MTIHDLVFIGLNGRVVALHRETGDEVWKWQPSTSGHKGFVALVADGDRLILSDNGYIYCLEALTGRQLWHNPLTGYGTGIAIVATAASNSGQSAAGAAAMAARQVASEAASAGVIASSA
ncbi:MAG TPA: PQQ-binding-like beta-propeller repeat protein [Gemmataceae bacterium]|nr:PQQ-binding-like beta-propeller repeat protein [Gemmataceae bacterium]